MKIYCDTCVYISALGLDKHRDPYKPLEDFAWVFLNAIKDGKYVLVTSSWLYEEFKKVIGSNTKLLSLIEDLKLSDRVHVEESENDIYSAKILSRNNLPDARHVILAKKANAMCITTFNIRDFIEFDKYLEENCIELKEPKDL